jgi:hypothetical protein
MEQKKSSMIYDHQATTTKDFPKILHTESESKQNHERAGTTKPQEKKMQESRE